MEIDSMQSNRNPSQNLSDKDQTNVNSNSNNSNSKDPSANSSREKELLKQNQLLKDKLKTLSDRLLELRDMAQEMESHEKVVQSLKDKLQLMEIDCSEKKALSSKHSLMKIQFRAFVSMSVDLINHVTIRSLQSMNQE